MASQVRVFVFEYIITMRADGQYFPDFIYPEQFNIMQGLHLVKHFVSGPPCRISRTCFFIPENSIADLQMGEYFSKCPCNFTVPVIKRTRTSNPE